MGYNNSRQRRIELKASLKTFEERMKAEGHTGEILGLMKMAYVTGWKTHWRQARDDGLILRAAQLLAAKNPWQAISVSARS